eukprot:jgi/Tetstr1/455235/TSEL_042082.t1
MASRTQPTTLHRTDALALPSLVSTRPFGQQIRQVMDVVIRGNATAGVIPSADAIAEELEVQEHYADGLDVRRLHHWHKLGPGDELKIQSGTVIQKDVLTKSHYCDGRKGVVFM